jgi:hypothetical protein
LIFLSRLIDRLRRARYLFSIILSGAFSNGRVLERFRLGEEDRFVEVELILREPPRLRLGEEDRFGEAERIFGERPRLRLCEEDRFTEGLIILLGEGFTEMPSLSNLAICDALRVLERELAMVLAFFLKGFVLFLMYVHIYTHVHHLCYVARIIHISKTACLLLASNLVSSVLLKRTKRISCADT